MSVKTIRILIAALAACLVLACLAGPAQAQDQDQDQDQEEIIKLDPKMRRLFRPYLEKLGNGEPVLRLPIVDSDLDLPNMTTLERMEILRLVALDGTLNFQRKQGKVITFGKLSVTSEPPGAQVWISSYTPKGTTPLTQ